MVGVSSTQKNGAGASIHGHAHHPRGGVMAVPRRRHCEEQPVSARTECGPKVTLRTRKQDFRRLLVNSLLKNGRPATSVRRNEDRFTVSCPIKRRVVPLVQRQPPGIEGFGAGF